MAIKGVTWIEQHFEKIVLGAVSATALGILGWQFVGRQSTITLSNKEVALDQANAELKAKALDIQNKIKATDPKMPEKFPVTAIATDFQGRHKAPVTPHRMLGDGGWTPPPGAVLVPGGAGVPGGVAEGPTNPLVVPVPATPIVESYIATMLKAQLDETVVLPETVTENDLVDIAYVTVETVFDGPALLAALKLDPEGPTRAMPEHWWSGQISLLGLELERQEMQDNGEWGAPAIVRAAKFGVTSLDQAGDPALNGTQLREIAKFAADRPDFVRRPHPPSPYIGEDWVSPGDVEKARPSLVEQVKLRKEIDALDERISRVDEQIKRTPADNKAAADSLNNRKRPWIIERNEKVTKYNDLIALSKSGPKAKADAPTPATPPPGKGREPAAVGVTPATAGPEPLLATSGIRVWAHDTDVKRNRAYRYRVRAVVSNPMFNQSAGLPANQKDLAKGALARSEPTAWTQPIHVDPELYYFVTAADDNKDAGGAAAATLAQEPVATAEVYSFKLGYWRTDSVRLHPGDPLLAEIPVPTLEQIRLAAGPANMDVPALVPVPAPGQPRDGGRPANNTPGAGGSRGGGGKSTGGGGGGGTTPPRPNEPRSATPVGGANQPKVPAPAAVKPRMVPVVVPVYLLDVAVAPATGGQGGDRYQAFFRGDNGAIEIRVPDDDRQQKAYQRVRMSAEAAELGGVRAIEARRDGPPPPQKGAEEKKPTGSGGG